MSIEGFNECSICFVQISNHSNVYKPKMSIGIICRKCIVNFTPQENEIIVHAFNVARGIFKIDKKDNETAMYVGSFMYDYIRLFYIDTSNYTVDELFDPNIPN